MYLMDAVADQHYHYFWMTVTPHDCFILVPLHCPKDPIDIPPLGVIEGSGAKHHGGNLGADG